jgi:hypothetical protein
MEHPGNCREGKRQGQKAGVPVLRAVVVAQVMNSAPHRWHCAIHASLCAFNFSALQALQCLAPLTIQTCFLLAPSFMHERRPHLTFAFIQLSKLLHRGVGGLQVVSAPPGH